MSLCPNLWVIVSTCITKWAQSHLGSLRKSEHGCDRAVLEEPHTFQGNTSLKTEGFMRGIAPCTTPSYFYTGRHSRGGGVGWWRGPCLIYDAHCEKDFNCTFWESVEGVDRAARITHKMINQVKLLHTPFQTQPGARRHVGETSCRVTDRERVTRLLFAFHWTRGCFSSELFIFEELKVWKYLDLRRKKER